MEKRLIARGLLAGAVGAVLAFVFARLLAEPLIGRAVEFEDARIEAAHAQGVHEHGAELFTRGVQGNAGLGFGVLIFGIAMGAIFAALFCVCYPRLGNAEPQPFSIRLAGAAFLAVYVVPFVKYPPNPPAVGQADTIGSRTLWYLVMVLSSVALAVAATWLARRLSARLGTFGAGVLAAGSYLVAMVIVMLALPSVAEIPPAFPADVLYEFRLASLGTQLVLWASIGLVFAWLAGRLLGGSARRARKAESIEA